MKPILKFTGLLAGVALSASAWAGNLYIAKDLAADDAPFRWESVNGINAKGQIIGQVFMVADQSHRVGFSGPAGEGFTELGSLDGGRTLPYDIDADGRIVGQSGYQAFVTGPQGQGMTALLQVPYQTYAVGINNDGTVVGNAFHDDHFWGFVYDTKTGSVGWIGDQFVASAINRYGYSVGTNRKDHPYQAFIAEPGGKNPRPLGSGTLGALSSAGSYPVDIDSNGVVIGNYLLNRGKRQGSFYTEPNGGAAHLLPTPQCSRSRVQSINKWGYIVGGCRSDKNFVAFRSHLPDLEFVDLNTLVDLPKVRLVDAFEINSAGMIVAVGKQNHYYLLIPNPASGLE
jgi:uncharacterized membrane protein